MSNTIQQTSPLHIENTVNSLARKELRLPQAFTTYRDMLEDEYVGGGYSLIQNLINKLDYKLVVDENASASQKRLVKALNLSLNNLEGINKTDLTNYQLSMCYYGVSLFEMVFKREQGLLVYNTFSPIHPTTVNRFVFKKNTLTQLVVNSADNDGLIMQEDIGQKTIKGEKVLMFRLNADLDNPLGRSMLSRCYTPWKKKQIVSEYEMIGIAKNLSGVLKIKAPSEYINAYYNDPTSENARYMEEMIEQAELLHNGKSCLTVIPSDTNDNGVSMFDITTIGNADGTMMDTNAIINRLDAGILTTLYTDIMMMGQSGGGSFALSDNKTNLLTLVIESILKTISRSFEKATKLAHKINDVKYEYPVTLEYQGIEQLDFDAFTRGWQRMAESGLITMDDELEVWLRGKAKAPAHDKDTARIKPDAVDQNERKEKEK